MKPQQPKSFPTNRQIQAIPAIPASLANQSPSLSPSPAVEGMECILDGAQSGLDILEAAVTFAYTRITGSEVPAAESGGSSLASRAINIRYRINLLVDTVKNLNQNL